MTIARQLTVLTALIATAIVPTSALAAPPANDAYAGATVVSSLPFSTTEGLSEATLGEAADTAAGDACGAIGTAGVGLDRTVWFDFRADRAQRIDLAMTA